MLKLSSALSAQVAECQLAGDKQKMLMVKVARDRVLWAPSGSLKATLCDEDVAVSTAFTQTWFA